jgi:DNA-binding MarR family transcriptional regulator
MYNSAQKHNTSEQKNNFPYFDLYSGGRHLNAVDFNTTLNMNQKHLLLVLGNQLDFRDVVKSKRYISVKSLSEKMSCSQRTVHTITSELKAMGYIEIEHRFEDNKQKSNYYSITDKVFREYYDKIGSANCAGGGMHGLQTEIPKKELPHENSILVPNIEGEKVAQSAPTPKECIFSVIGEEGVESKIKPEGKKKKAKAPKHNRPPVTQSHQKMVRIFTPKPELKSFVHRNDILFAVDELIEEYGEVSHKVIDYMYQYMKKNNKCGEYPWIVGRINDLFSRAFDDLKGKSNE